MVLRLLLPLCLFLLLQPSLGQPKFVDVPIDSDAVPESPIEVAGKLSVRETVAGNEVASLWEGDVTVKNISNKPIVLLVGVFDANGPHSHGGSGFVMERFFSETVMQPGDTFPVTAGKIRRGECCVNPFSEPRDPRARFRVEFVQFLDGSTFGDDSEGKDVLASRISARQLLQRLDDAYSRRGEQEFEAQLKHEVALKEADVLTLHVILKTEKEKE